MRSQKLLRPLIAVALCISGFALARITPYREGTVMLEAGGCRMVTDLIDKGNDETSGSVVLFHGLAANKKIMSYLAHGFANENLRVFVPDLPGHGRTAGPFSFERAEACAESLTRQLIARRAIDPQRTIIAGHSMGGAIAIRVAARVGVAGVVAISPAPMRAAHGVPGDMLPYTSAPSLPPHTLAMSGEFEPLAIRELTRDLITGDASGTGKYLFLPRASHVSILFDGRAVRASQEWSADALHFPAQPAIPSHAPLAGSLMGLAGLLLLAGPFVHETVTLGSSETTRAQAAAGEAQNSGVGPIWRALLEMAVASFLAVALLRFWNPLWFVRLYNGSYLASFLVIVGLALLVAHYKSVRLLFTAKIGILVGAAAAGLLLHFLITAWLDATFSESWVTWVRWARFPVLFVAALAGLLGEELLLGSVRKRVDGARVSLALAVRFVAFLALVFGIFVLHSGAILVLLLVVYLALFSILQRMGMDIVRYQTGSAMAAAVFGAILLAGFCLVIFPIT
jgi:pimeloyl-ACP methyl ester carboxylesterase